jgi:hypothetical protein
VLFIGLLASGSSSALFLPEAAAQTTHAGESRAAKSLVYKNEQYGFVFSLPESWKGYAILTRHWDWTPSGHPSGVKDEHGPILIIRHPHWTKAEPREDIPIMVFTRSQWRRVENGELIVSAAPFSPGELGRNAKWVFALPPRFDYDLLTGVEEVDQIIENKPLHAF